MAVIDSIATFLPYTDSLLLIFFPCDKLYVSVSQPKNINIYIDCSNRILASKSMCLFNLHFMVQ